MTVLFFIVLGLSNPGQWPIVPESGTLNSPNYTAFQFTNIVPPAYLILHIALSCGVDTSGLDKLFMDLFIY